MVKLLFLDVDGVINVPHGMDRRLLNNLREIVEETQCKIVLSSDWRNTTAARSEIRGILRSFGMDYISCTGPSKSPMQARRPEEIMDWIRAHTAKLEKSLAAQGGGGAPEGLAALGKIEAFVAIDDRPLLGEVGGAYLRGHFVQTNTCIGLTAQRAQLAKDILLGRTAPAENSGQQLPMETAVLRDERLLRAAPGEATAYRASKSKQRTSDPKVSKAATGHLAPLGGRSVDANGRSASLTSAGLRQLGGHADRRSASLPVQRRGQYAGRAW